jgi:hypothetical protein
MPSSSNIPKFLPGSAYGPRHARAHASVMRVIKRMTPAEFLQSLEAAELGPVLDIGGRKAAAKKKDRAKPSAGKRAAKKVLRTTSSKKQR